MIIKRLGWSDRFIVPARTVLEISHHYHNWAASTRALEDIKNKKYKYFQQSQNKRINLLHNLLHNYSYHPYNTYNHNNPTTMLWVMLVVLFSPTYTL